jgi:hypothetical protein
MAVINANAKARHVTAAHPLVQHKAQLADDLPVDAGHQAMGTWFKVGKALVPRLD